MRYSTDFWDEFTIDKPLDDETYALLEGLSQTRRMSRDIVKLGKRVYEIENPTPEDIANWEKEFGCEGEFWVGDTEQRGDRTEDVINGNQPPATQPGLCVSGRYSKTDKQSSGTVVKSSTSILHG